VRSARNSGESLGGVLIAHPGTQHSYETALAIHEAGLLRSYITGYYYKPEVGITRVVERLPLLKLKARLRERKKPGLPEDKVTTCPILEMVAALAREARIWRPQWEFVKNAMFDSYAARVVLETRPKAVLCYDVCAGQTFKAAESIGALRILDQTIAYLKTCERLLKEERLLHSEFADGPPTTFPAWVAKRSASELKAANFILAPSEFVRSSLIEASVPANRIVLLPYGVDIDAIKPRERLATEPCRLLFVGLVSQRKGIQYLLECARRLNLKKDELWIVGGIVGSEARLAPYRMHFTHFTQVSKSAVPKFYSASDVGVFPSLLEGSSLAIYEAMAAGLPIVTTPNSGSIVRDGIDGFIVPIRDVNTLAERIQLLRRDPCLRREMGRNARKQVESYSWVGYRRRIGDLFRNLLAANGEHTGSKEVLGS